MGPAASLCSGNGAVSRSASSGTHRQLAHHAHITRCDIGPVSAPLHAACCSTATRQRGGTFLSHARKRICTFSSTSRLLQSPHPQPSSISCRQLTGRSWPQHRGRQSGRHANLQPALAAAGTSSGGGQSMDDDEEGDAGVTRELEGYEVERFRQMGRHLDLMWNVGKKPQPAPCDCCGGSGSRNCGYCNSTGAMMVGHERFCSLEQGCKPCPICNGTGEVKCSHCQGTGYRAGWLEPGCPVEQ